MTVVRGLLAALVEVLLARTVPPCLEDPAPLLDQAGDPRRYPAAFLFSLCSERHPRYDDAGRILAEPGELAAFFRRERKRVLDEVDTQAARAPAMLEALQSAASLATDTPASEVFETMWKVTFPEGVGVRDDWSGATYRLRHRRRVVIEAENATPIVDPIAEVLLTSNVLVSPGAEAGTPVYWYDHPIPLGAAPAATELAHGLTSIDAAVGFEQSRHPEWPGPATVALSLSSTHGRSSLEELAFVRAVLASVGPLPNLRVFCFDERLSSRLWNEVIAAVPVAGGLPPPGDTSPVFGVSGPYGRHYSFLKALAPLWAICIDPRVRATYKFDLDQSFPQEQLVAETGQSAFEHLTTSVWGAQARTTSGQAIDLVMLAGGLVNQADIQQSIFTPDVQRVQPSTAEHAIFFSPLVQAISTEGEIVTRSDQLTNGMAQERVHVTGGTTGALVAGLRRWRPFTPSCFGRAEDQAYLLSAVDDAEERPGYVHEPGLIMRHDKVDLIPDVIEGSANAKHIGDLVRMRLFSEYGAAHKSLLDPFTGCFVSKVPITVTALRFAIHALELAEAAEVERYLHLGSRRLRDADATVSSLAESVIREREQWDFYYSALDALESGLRSTEPWALEIKASAQAIVAAAAVGSTN